MTTRREAERIVRENFPVPHFAGRTVLCEESARDERGRKSWAVSIMPRRRGEDERIAYIHEDGEVEGPY